MKTVVLVIAGMLLALAPARAQPDDALFARLSAEKAGAVEPGLYSAGEGLDFSLEPYRDKYLLRFSSSPENFVLTADPVSLGGKLLKYDTGTTALLVPVWGGLTLYVAEAPGGLPATRQGDAAPVQPPIVSAAALDAALHDEASHFGYADSLALKFTADSGAMASADSRAMAFDTLTNVQTGIERLIAGSPPARQALGKRVATVHLAPGAKPGLALAGRDLTISFVPADGYLGRASSHAVAHQLGKLLAINTLE